MFVWLRFVFFLMGTALWNSSQAVVTRCVLTDENLRFIQDSLAGWEKVSRDFLRLEPDLLPWMLLFDSACVWHLRSEYGMRLPGEPVNLPLTFAGKRVPAHARAHDGTVRLPDGIQLSVQARALASLYKNDEASFLVLALPDVWRLDPMFANDPNFETAIFGVMSHEIVHTQQLVPVAQRIRKLGTRYALPGQLHDDIVEERFKNIPEYQEAYRMERDLLYQAVAETNAEQRRSLVAKALKLANKRRDRYFVGADTMYRELESIFLNMEGVAVWSAFKLAQASDAIESDTDPRSFRWSKNAWSHDEGLALFLLIEKMVPDWQDRVLGSELASPFTLLEEAIR